MKLYVDATIFASPTDAYGNVTGELEFPSVPEVGDEVRLLSHTVKVEAVLEPPEGQTNPLISLGDIVVASREEAKAFGEKVEREFGLDMWEYDVDEPDEGEMLWLKARSEAFRFGRACAMIRDHNPHPAVDPLGTMLETLVTVLLARRFSQTEIRAAFEAALVRGK